ncbi:MAG: MFS transporter [Anaerolineae bacterium]|nr:MAG: MFS transporter [Anaerolineae bacterium]
MRERSSPYLQLPLITAIRVLFNTAYRMAYPFLGVFARGLGVDLAAMSLALTTRSVVGGIAPLLAPVADRRGRKVGMLLGITLLIGGSALVAFWPTFPALAISLTLTTLGKYIFDPAMQAYLGDRVDYEQRGLVIAVTEMGWSLSFIFGIPLAGFLIARNGWVAPFPLIALLSALTFAILFLTLPEDPTPTNGRGSPKRNLRLVLTSAPALAGLSLGLWATVANEVVNLIFGVWLEDSLRTWIGPEGFGGVLAFLNFFRTTLGFDIALLILASIVIGFSELGGESLVAMLADRLGKERAIALGLVANNLAALLLPLLGTTALGALVGLFLFYITFEFTLVSIIPLMTEVLPEARATLMAFNVAALSLGRALGAPLAPFLYRFGLPAVVLGAVCFNVLALLALRWVRRPPRQEEAP